MILSGSHTPGVRAEDFRLPPDTALRYERPMPVLRRFVLSYAVLDSEPVAPTSEWMLPGWGQIWIVFAPKPVHVRVGNRRYPTLPTAALLGPTSRAMPVGADGGVSIVIDVSPLGWARLFKIAAVDVADRMVPLDTVMDPARVNRLRQDMRHIDRGRGVKALLDHFFVEHLGPSHPQEQSVERMMTALFDDATTDASILAAQVGLDSRKLRTLARRHFGFTPINLLLRRRFLAALIPMFDPMSGVSVDAVPPRYHDASHFTRDAKRFLGMTHRRFLALEKPYYEAVLRARAAVVGSPISALDFEAVNRT